MAAQNPYQDASLPISERVDDLLSLMILPEKAGQLFHNMIAQGPNGTLSQGDTNFGLPSTQILLHEKQMSHFNLIGSITNPIATAKWHNTLQAEAQKTRLGIPITLSSDPRHHFTDNVGTSFNAASFSQFPETLGLAALRSPALVERFADIARQEYLAIGLRVPLHPQIDLATEPRWSRINSTFGEDTTLTGELGAAYIRGFQCRDKKDGVSCMTKHFPGGGPQKDGEDPHFEYGKEQVYPGEMFEYHLEPFRKAIEAGTSQIMPYYGMPVGLVVDGVKIEEVGFAFDKQIITGQLREKLGFQGLVCTDWGLLTDASILGQSMPARAWGCEGLSVYERIAKILDADCDQFGGESCPELLIEAVEKGLVSEKRVDESVRRVLKEKFELGLFDERRFVDVENVTSNIAKPEWVRFGAQLQRSCYTVLKNGNGILPLTKTSATKVYTEGFDKSLLHDVTVVNTPEEADVALIRLKAPYEPRSGGFEAFFHAGSLEYSAAEKARQARVCQATTTIVDLYLDRPAIVPELAKDAAALLCSYGSSAEAFLDVVFGQTKPIGKLPFDLPSSTQRVRESKEDVPFSTKDPLYKFGDGLEYTM